MWTSWNRNYRPHARLRGRFGLIITYIENFHSVFLTAKYFGQPRRKSRVFVRTYIFWEIAFKMADVAGYGCTSADSSLRGNTQELNPRRLGSLEESWRGRIEPPSHLTMSWCGLAAGIACRWVWGGAQPTFWCPLPFRSTRHALNPRSLSFLDVESKLADGRGGPTSTSTRKKKAHSWRMRSRQPRTS